MDTIKEIIDYLNQKTGKNFRPQNKETQKIISRLLNDGYIVEDFYKVIDNKTYEWLNTNMDQYLRPITLFRPSNFESYLNQRSQAEINIKIIDELK